MLNAIIIDDEPDAAELLEVLINKYIKNIEISGSAQTVTDGLEMIENLKPDILFLDIDLRNETGFDLLKRIDKPNFETIFITAYSSYAIEAFKFSAVDYILKPVDVDLLSEAVNRVIKNLAKIKKTSYDLGVLYENLNSSAPCKLAISTEKGISYVKISDIIQIIADGNYSNITLNDGKKISGLSNLINPII